MNKLNQQQINQLKIGDKIEVYETTEIARSL